MLNNLVISFCGEEKSAILTESNEPAWAICDCKFVFDYIVSMNKVILGGDILDINLEYTYDSWYFNYCETKDRQRDIIDSYNKAINYINKYLQCNGNNYFVVIVTD